MTAAELVTLSPLIVLSATPLVIMLVIAVRRSHLLTIGLTLTGLTIACLLLPVAASTGTQHVTTLLLLDRYALFYLGLIFAASLVVAGHQLRGQRPRRGDQCSGSGRLRVPLHHQARREPCLAPV